MMAISSSRRAMAILMALEMMKKETTRRTLSRMTVTPTATLRTVTKPLATSKAAETLTTPFTCSTSAMVVVSWVMSVTCRA